MSTDPRTRAWIEVRRSALRRNLRRIREAVGPGVGLIPMVKADGYGLGARRVVEALEPLEPWGYGVASVEEGRELRDVGVRRPVLVASPLPPDLYEAAVRADLTVSVSELPALRRLSEAGRRVGRDGRFHLEVDTGMGRAGFDWRRVRRWGGEVAGRAARGPRWTGCFTHFHSADLDDDASVLEQWERFQEVVEALRSLDGVPDLLIHACNSAAALRRPELAADAVRTGIFMYGGSAGRALPRPQGVVAVRGRILLVRDVPPGTTLGYGATHAARGEERWATVGIGYGDGLPRALSNRGHGLLRGRRVPIVGRISMDVTVVDITGLDRVEAGEPVTFVGRDGEEEVTVDEVAELADTIGYEVLTGFTPRLPRVWLDDGEAE